MNMKHALRVLAVAVVVIGLGVWIALGAGLGWTKTSKAVMETDPVTGLVYPVYTTGFYPGADFLAGILALGGVFFAASFLARSRPNGN